MSKEINKIEFYKEVILQMLAKINAQIEEFKLNDEISAIEKLEKEVISKYEKLFLGFNEMKELPNDTKIPEYIERIMMEANFTEEFINSCMEKRKEYKNHSGAEVVKKLYLYEIKKLQEAQDKLLEEANILLDKEDILSMELKNAIQEEEEMKCIYKLQPIRKKYREIEKNILDIHKKIKSIKNKIEAIWPYEIYGTIKEDEMKKTFEKIFK